MMMLMMMMSMMTTTTMMRMMTTVLQNMILSRMINFLDKRVTADNFKRLNQGEFGLVVVIKCSSVLDVGVGGGEGGVRR